MLKVEVSVPIWRYSRDDTVSKVATKIIESYTSEPCEYPRVTDVTAQDTLDSKIA